MTGTVATAAAVLAGLGAAGSFGAGVALQHRQVQAAPPAGRAPLRLLAQLARQPLWLAGLGLAASAYGLQALALAFGPLSLVAPVVATDLLFALPLAARWSRRPMRARDWAGCALAGGGIAIFLAAAPPGAGRPAASDRAWVLAFAIVALVAGAAVAAALLTSGSARAALLALAGGTVFGLTAALTLSVTRLLGSAGVAGVLARWQTWALIVLGTAGLLLSAATFQAGPLAASLPVIDTVEPVSAVLIGTLVFGEQLAASPAGLAVQLAGAAVAVAGIIVLGRSSLGSRIATTAPAPADPVPAAPGPVAPGPVTTAPVARERAAVPLEDADRRGGW